MKPGMAKRGLKGASLDQLEKNLEEAFAILDSMGVSNVSAFWTIYKFIYYLTTSKSFSDQEISEQQDEQPPRSNKLFHPLQEIHQQWETRLLRSQVRIQLVKLKNILNYLEMLHFQDQRGLLHPARAGRGDQACGLRRRTGEALKIEGAKLEPVGARLEGGLRAGQQHGGCAKEGEVIGLCATYK